MQGEIVKSIYIIFKISYISQESFRFCIIKKQLPNTIRGTVPILSDNHRDKIIYPEKNAQIFFFVKAPATYGIHFTAKSCRCLLFRTIASQDTAVQATEGKPMLGRVSFLKTGGFNFQLFQQANFASLPFLCISCGNNHLTENIGPGLLYLKLV